VHKILLLIFCSSIPAWACVCPGWPSAKQAWHDSPVVFVGTVEFTDPIFSSHVRYEEQISHVTVEEPFKNSRKGQKFDLKQSSGNCSTKFKRGERFLFYLHKDGSPYMWTARGCHRTRRVEDAHDDFLFLRGLPGTDRGNRLSGTVKHYDTKPNRFRKIRSLPGVKVIATSMKGKAVSTLTDANGVYQWYGLPEAEYQLSIEVPKGMRVHTSVLYGVRLSGLALLSQGDVVQLAKESGVGVDFYLEATR